MLNRFVNADGVVRVWPKKQADKILVLEYLITKFDSRATYAEREVTTFLKRGIRFLTGRFCVVSLSTVVI